MGGGLGRILKAEPRLHVGNNCLQDALASLCSLMGRRTKQVNGSGSVKDEKQVVEMSQRSKRQPVEGTRGQVFQDQTLSVV